ncbi:MAG: 4Fe-4S binding protein [Oscillospiraceae bacterium]|nr:4Fe-4S binding protein [Oscillospiraceae bacterium]
MTCRYECPVGAISLIEDVSAQIDPEKCLGCGSCFDACQPGAIEPYEEEEA